MKLKVDKVQSAINTFVSVRKIIALMLTIVFCYLSINGTITQEQFIPVFSMVLGYYFGKSTALDVPGENNTIKDNNDKTNDVN